MQRAKLLPYIKHFCNNKGLHHENTIHLLEINIDKTEHPAADFRYNQNNFDIEHAVKQIPSALYLLEHRKYGACPSMQNPAACHLLETVARIDNIDGIMAENIGSLRYIEKLFDIKNYAAEKGLQFEGWNCTRIEEHALYRANCNYDDPELFEEDEYSISKKRDLFYKKSPTQICKLMKALKNKIKLSPYNFESAADYEKRILSYRQDAAYVEDDTTYVEDGTCGMADATAYIEDDTPDLPIGYETHAEEHGPQQSIVPHYDFINSPLKPITLQPPRRYARPRTKLRLKLENEGDIPMGDIPIGDVIIGDVNTGYETSTRRTVKISNPDITNPFLCHVIDILCKRSASIRFIEYYIKKGSMPEKDLIYIYNRMLSNNKSTAY
jgi:hypothetical protein